ncbi:MAG: transcription-repair coupling factor [Anaerolineales bacterium]
MALQPVASNQLSVFNDQELTPSETNDFLRTTPYQIPPLTPTMPLADSLTRHLITSSPLQRLLSQVREYEDVPNLALPRPARLAVLAAIHAELNVPLLFITDRTDHALTLLDELSLWVPHAPRLLFPEPTPLFYEPLPWSETTRRERLNVLTQLAAYHIPGARQNANAQPLAENLSRAEHRDQTWQQIRGQTRPGGETAPIIIAPARALMTRTLPRRDFLKNTRSLKPGQVLQPSTLARTWVEMGYEPVQTVLAPGQFARRGGLLDVWPPAEPNPIRLDFFGDEIDTLRLFDPATQRTTDKVDRILLTPAREYLLSTGDGRPKTDQPSDLPPPLPSPPSPIPSPPSPVLSEFALPLLHPPASLLDYLPDQALILLDDLEAIEQITHEIETQALELRRQSLANGTLPETFPTPYLPWAELYDTLSYKRFLQFGPASDLQKSDLARMFTPNPRFGGRIKAVLDHLLVQLQRGDTCLLISRQSSRLQELWKEQTLHANTNAPLFLQGALTEGFLLSPPGEKRIHLLTDGEIFGWRRAQPRQRAQTIGHDAPEAAYADLQTGDWVVHVDHGIGRFLGLVHRLIDGVEREYLSVEYDDGDQLFVPVHQADRLTRYIGPDGRDPSPTKLGTTAWKNARERVEQAVAEVAEDLLALYSKRQTVVGYAFSPDAEWHHELEASFPYVETEDQLRVINEVKRDMETPRPMDRLICGDVGYGKTEVALRAAFKAVYDGKQVAMLVPTTVLAQQHYNTFRERLAPFPVRVEMLSRFRTDAEQREILFNLALGEIDIIIGTHRLLSGDVEFADLGLLIIDEEQRFGVTHKETLKKMRTEVDVLTMTATPIPRTLYMALTGVRDISTINTPPEERLPIITHVGPYEQTLIRQAILRELERGGQVFFVHNRVQTIYGMKNHLLNLVPEARVGVAHGQMPEKELSERMEEFAAGEVNVLLCTSIIESGLDIPNANTLIIDRADTFGLAQLYQLRGRVGRSAHQAYAYFFKHRKKPPTEEGRARLETLAENTQLGAGFSIAMRDLELRGAGDLLGTRQHGHIAAVGFHLYTRLLAQAVQQQRSLAGDRPIPQALTDIAAVYAPRPMVNVDLPLAATIPKQYISDRDTRLRLYRRLAEIRNLDEVEALRGEFTDRFGPIPREVEELLYQLKVKLLAEQAGVVSVFSEGHQIVLKYPTLPEEAPPRVVPYAAADVRVSKNAVRVLRAPEGDWRPRVLEVLEAIKN